MNEQWLDEMLSQPSDALVDDIAKIDGDIMILGAGGKVGPALAVMAKRAVNCARIDKRVVAVSRFTDSYAVALLKNAGVETISADLSDALQIGALPKLENIIYMAGRKFGTGDNADATWVMNTGVPMMVVNHFGPANYVVFSTGNVYPMANVTSGGCTETDPVNPVGEYAMSSLGRERVFQYAAKHMNAKAVMFRLNYAVDLRYGVLLDIAERIEGGLPVNVTNPCFNCVWQGYVNEVAVRALLHTQAPASVLNVTGPETVSVRTVAKQLAAFLDKPVTFEGEESSTALLNNAGKCLSLFGYPSVTLNQMIEWQAAWIKSGYRTLGKPTHFEEKKGNF